MIHRMQAKNFMGLRLVEYEFPAAGALLEGRNGGGKTSTLKAIRAALSAQGIDADAITSGAESAEVLIDLDDVTVRRRISATTGKGSLTITRSDGSSQPSPQAYLQELLGIAPLDPIDLVAGGATASEKAARAAKLLAALPATVGVEQLARWAPDVDLALALGTGAGGKPDVSGHGLEVLGKVRASAYDARTVANRLVKEARAGVERALAEAQRARTEAFGAEDTPEPPEGTDPVAWAHDGILRAITAEERAGAELAAARAQDAAQARQREASARTSARVAELREQARGAREAAPTVPSEETLNAAEAAIAAAIEGVQAAEREAERLRALYQAACDAVADAKGVHAAAREERSRLIEAQQDAEEAEGVAKRLEAQAGELEAASGVEAAPIDIDAATREHEDAKAKLARARLAARFFELVSAADRAQADEVAAAAKAARLDAQVKALTKDAPAALMAASGGVPGLEVDGTDIRLDGVSLDRLSSAEQLRFAVRIAKRLNAKSKLLVIDGLERVDPEALPAFLEEATSDDFQLLATRVAAGPVHVTPLGGAQ